VLGHGSSCLAESVEGGAGEDEGDEATGGVDTSLSASAQARRLLGRRRRVVLMVAMKLSGGMMRSRRTRWVVGQAACWCSVHAAAGALVRFGYMSTVWQQEPRWLGALHYKAFHHPVLSIHRRAVCWRTRSTAARPLACSRQAVRHLRQ
jgi:hypothetical protein